MVKPMEEAETKPSWTARSEINLVVNKSFCIQGMVRPYPRSESKFSFILETIKKGVQFCNLR